MKKATPCPVCMIGALLLADTLAVILSVGMAVVLRYWWGGKFTPYFYAALWPWVGIFVVGYAFAGLYPGIGISPPDELRRVTLTSTAVFLILGVATFLAKQSQLFSRAVFLMAWTGVVVLVPLGRSLVRNLFASRAWWGYPVIVFGAGKTGFLVIKSLRKNPGMGLRPIVVLDDDWKKHNLVLEGVPVIGGREKLSELSREGVRHVIVAMPGVEPRKLVGIVEQLRETFPRVILIPDLFGLATLWVSAKDLGGVLGLELSEKLLSSSHQFVKRTVDLAVTVVGGTMVLPVMGIIAILIKLDSSGPVFYRHTRIGYQGKRFTVLKFRTMVQDADVVLKEYLKKHPDLRREWEKTQKLRHDPRVTRVGRWLRKTSLDELPQLWNVLRGEMSLVGPRPIVEEEIEKYGGLFSLFKKVRPGMTGLWQVSGRSDTTYEERVNLDAYYVRNWSIWLDIYILARTVKVVLFGRGAY